MTQPERGPGSRTTWDTHTMKGLLFAGLVALAAACGNAPMEPSAAAKPRVAAAGAVTLTPATIASIVGDKDTVVGTASCLLAWRNLDSTKIKVLSTFKGPGQTKANSAVVQSLATGTAGLRGGCNGAADTTTFTITNNPPPDTVGVQAAQADALVETFSVQLHLGQGGIYDSYSTIIKPRLQELGIRHVRERMFGDSTTIQQHRDLGAAGIRLTAGCWPQGTVYTDASHCIARANAIGSAAIDAFDGWNEVNGQGVANWEDAWVTWQQEMFDTYNADPTWNNRPILANSFTSVSATNSFFSLKGNQSSRVDAGNMHNYPGGNSTPEGTVEDSWINANNQLVSPKPLWTTEMGYHTCTGAVGNASACGGIGVSELAQAKYTGREYLEQFRRGVVRTNIYELMDEGTVCGVNGTDREDCWGLVRNDNTVKPAFTTVKSIIALLADPGATFAAGKLNYTLSGTNASTRSVLLQKRDGRFYLVIWQALKVYNETTETDITNAAQAVTLTLPNSRPWKVYKPTTNGTTATSTGTGTSVSLSVPDHVMIVEIG